MQGCAPVSGTRHVAPTGSLIRRRHHSTRNQGSNKMTTPSGRAWKISGIDAPIHVCEQQDCQEKGRRQHRRESLTRLMFIPPTDPGRM